MVFNKQFSNTATDLTQLPNKLYYYWDRAVTRVTNPLLLAVIIYA